MAHRAVQRLRRHRRLRGGRRAWAKAALQDAPVEDFIADGPDACFVCRRPEQSIARYSSVFNGSGSGVSPHPSSGSISFRSV